MRQASLNRVESLVKQVAIANKEHEPPIPLNDKELIVFKGITQSREFDTWRRTDLHVASLLSKTLCGIDHLWAQIEREGYQVINARGTPIQNPACAAMLQMTSTMQALMRTLGITAGAQGLANPTAGRRALAEKDVRETLEGAKDDDLI
jgi:phage terminase small subunit